MSASGAAATENKCGDPHVRFPLAAMFRKFLAFLKKMKSSHAPDTSALKKTTALPQVNAAGRSFCTGT